MATFLCTACKLSKNETEFATRKSNSGNDLRRRQCKGCVLEKSRQLYAKNSSKILSARKDKKDQINEYKKIWYGKNKKSQQDRVRKYRDNLSDSKKKEIQYQKSKWHQDNKERNIKRIVEYQKNRRKTDISFRLKDNFSKSIRNHLKKNGVSKNRSNIFDFLQYSLSDLKQHIENQFEPWMNWENWGKYNPQTWNDEDKSTWTWEIDHIVPQSEFHFTFKHDSSFLECWALNNLRPFSSKQNLLDGASRIRHRRVG